MFSGILDPEIQAFINNNIGVDISKLALQKNPFPDADWPEILNQIAAKTKAKSKLPTWFSAGNIIYPSKISIEQTSSEITALYKSRLVSGDNLIDLTGGFGVDDFYFSKVIKAVVHCEMNADLSEIVKHNFGQLGIENTSFYSNDSTSVLKEINQKFNWIYIDPSRRNDAKGKVFMLKDCLPNVPELLDLYFSYTDNILIKTAPILDIAAGLGELHFVKSIHIVAVDNEVKELLWELSKDYDNEIEIKTVNITKGKEEHFNFILDENVNAEIGLPEKFLYEPNSAIMKSGGFENIGNHFGLKKLHQHSHLYTSAEIIDFPGRVFKIENYFFYTKNDMKKFLQNQKSNLTTRNFPETVENIRKKWKIKDGGDQYCFFTTDANNDKIVLICTKI
ncbi:THUMP-like domain-containing protein [Flavobacterium sp. 3HN19-14]|uniref:THUMP-like domain-containing protein n=1 Tax=Flavobacterium sp. 3HN19-14 TaxID=3448133 RepID=UPI003EE39BA6